MPKANESKRQEDAIGTSQEGEAKATAEEEPQEEPIEAPQASVEWRCLT